ncbi:hypothetical protein ON010_g7673 [Phytophthora cinnamomi]|nr:hypothetical protein ON010_g7673 [Phytophthora cinnamomi]
MLAPQIFTNSIEGLRAKANYLVELGITRELLPCIVARAPTCLGMNSARIKETVDALDEMFGAGAGIRALTWNCIIVMYNINGMRESFDYLISLGFTRERLEKNTRFITRNVDRFLRPRAQFLVGKDHSLIEDTSWILMPEGLFIKKYPDYEAYFAEYKANEKQKDNA